MIIVAVRLASANGLTFTQTSITAPPLAERNSMMRTSLYFLSSAKTCVWCAQVLRGLRGVERDPGFLRLGITNRLEKATSGININAIMSKNLNIIKLQKRHCVLKA